VIFNETTLSYVDPVYWFFQKHDGEFDPNPLQMRGAYGIGGYAYAAQRTNDVVNPSYGTNVSSPASRDLDVAALYFPGPAGRGGFGGYLASDAPTNEWLTGPYQKMLVGYPVDASAYGCTNILPGKMHATPTSNYTFSRQNGHVYATSGILGLPGDSGGPVYVRCTNGLYYPAAVYLGTVNNAWVVRAIDSNVVSIITRAATLGDAGTNNTGGGVITITAGAGSGFLAYVQVPIGPASAVAAGAAWRVYGTTAWSAGPTYTATIARGNSVTLEFKPIPGWNVPINNTVQIVLGQLTVVPAIYTPVVPPAAPVLSFNPAAGLGITGTAGAKFRLEYRTSLVSGQWLPLKTNTLGPGFNLLLPWPPTNGPAAFYRAVWLP